MDAEVAVVLGKDGGIESWSMTKSSGLEAFDATVNDALKTASLYAEFDRKFEKRSGKIYVRFRTK